MMRATHVIKRHEVTLATQKALNVISLVCRCVMHLAI